MSLRLFSLLLLLGTLGGCSKGIDNSRLRVDVIADQPQSISMNALPLGDAGAYLRMASAQGLVSFDKSGHIVPALAARWIVTDDGLSYIFRLNKIRWNNGHELTAEQVATALSQRIDQIDGSRLGYELGMVDRVVSMTGKVVEIRLKAPVPNLLETLAQPELGLVQSGFGSGPMQARKQGGSYQLRMRELDEKGRDILSDDRMTLRSDRAPEALARFQKGEIDFITGGRYDDVPSLTAAKISGGVAQFDPVPGLFGLRFVGAGPFLSRAENREAIAMAIDRPKLLTSFDMLAWQEAISLMPETLLSRKQLDRPAWNSLRIADRKIQAHQTIAHWISGNGKIRAIKIAISDKPGGRMIFAQLASDLHDIGIDAVRVDLDDTADLQLVDRVADLSSPIWYLSQLSCAQSPVCDAEADALVEKARVTKDSELRAYLLNQAEMKMQSKRIFIPIANPLRWSVTRNGLLGFAINPRGWHPLNELGRQ